MRAKRKLARYGGLGFVDSKQALYGVNASGTLELFIPLDDPSVDIVVVCGVNELRGENECKMERDVAFVLGGTPVNPELMIFGSASYLGKSICCELPIPPDIIRSSTRRSAIQEEKNRMGISLKISVQSMRVTTKDGACSISHVVVGYM